MSAAGMPGQGPEHWRLLLVEDNAGDAGLILEALDADAAAGHRVTVVSSLAAAAAALGEARHDAVLLDLLLPDGEGVACVQAMRAVAETVPIVVLTGLEQHALALACIAAGAQDYIAKDELQPRTLRRAIAYAIVRLREAEERGRADALRRLLATIVEGSRDAIFSGTPDGRITSWNRGAELIFGHSAEEAIGQPFDRVVRARNAEEAAMQREWVHSALRLGAEMQYDAVRLDRAGRTLSLSVVTSPLEREDGAVTGFAVIARDLTEYHRRAEALRERNDELARRDGQMRALAARLNAIREEERTRISREVHDVLGQLLTGLRMDLGWIERRVKQWPEAAALGVPARLAQADELVRQTIGTVQRIAIELRPSALDSLGLAAAIRDEARRFGQRSGLAVEAHTGEEARPDPATATVLFRILQEMLTNVARHARATRVRVDFSTGGRLWRLDVADDGVGFAVDEVERRASLGLLGMRERAGTLGGRVRFASGPGLGTTATVEIPWAAPGGMRQEAGADAPGADR